MAAPPKPIFVFFGIDGGATCCHVDQNRMFIGSFRGRVQNFGVESKVLEQTVYVDEEERKIQSLEYSDDHLFVHLRGHAILRLKEPENKTCKSTHWPIVQTIEVDHIGFCNSLLVGPLVVFPSEDQSRHSLLCFTTVNLPESNTSSFQIDTNPDNTPMHMTRGENDKQVIVGMEDGRLAIVNDLENSEARPEWIKLGKEPIFCVASCSKWIAAGCARAPLYLVSQEQRTSREVNYPPDASGCSSITFSPNCKQILAGFSDGSIRVFSCLRLTVLLSLTSTHSSSITSLIWRRPEDGECVVATSLDATVSMWKLR